MDSIQQILEKRLPFFEKALRQEILDRGTVVELSAGNELIRLGQYIKTFPILLEGHVKVTRNDAEGRELLLYFLNPGDTCSMALTCCLGDQQSNINATAEENCMLVQLPTDCIDQWMNQFPSWKTYVMYAYRKRFDELLETIDAIAFLELDDRLVRFFYARFKATGETTYQGTHLDIANYLNSSREVVSRLLKQMEAKGMVNLKRGLIDFSPIISVKE